VAKASEILGERWMLLVLRELLLGASRYRDLQRGLGRISPSVLSSRLKTLIDHGLLEKVDSAPTARSRTDTRASTQGFAYRLTPAGAELAPLVEGIGIWGQRWVRSRMTRDELDVELIMLSVQRNLAVSAFPESHAVLAFIFDDLHGALRRWWLLVDDGRTELCAEPPGRPEHATLSCKLVTLAEVVTGDVTLGDALARGRLQIKGASKIVRSVRRWFGVSPLAGVPAARKRPRGSLASVKGE
jgi:DNA-binding HxlR family transcriptional regulator